MISEESLRKYLEDFEKYMLGDFEKGKLPSQLIWSVNVDEDREKIIRNLLRWILNNKYYDTK